MMNSKPVTVIVHVQAKPGREAGLRQTLLDLIPPTRKEAGCVNYDLFVAPDDPAKFLFYENWANRDALDAHLQTPHLQVLLPRLNELAVGMPQIQIWKKIG